MTKTESRGAVDCERATVSFSSPLQQICVMSGEASVMAGVDNEKAVSAALKDPSTEMPPGARHMTEIERAERIDAIVEALTKQACYENMYCNILKTKSIDTNLSCA